MENIIVEGVGVKENIPTPKSEDKIINQHL